MELWVAAGIDGDLKKGTEQIVEEDTEVLKNVVVFVDITVKEDCQCNNTVLGGTNTALLCFLLNNEVPLCN